VAYPNAYETLMARSPVLAATVVHPAAFYW